MTTAKLHPEGRATIDLIAANSKTFSYAIDLGTLDLNEGKRLEIAYSEGVNVEGGEAISSHGPLVPVSFDIFVQGSGASKGVARAQMIERTEALQQAVCNTRGGTFEYKPDELGAGIRSTFYYYEQSALPQLRTRAGNNWDGALVDSSPGAYIYQIALEIELQTQPFATSDPDSPVSVSSPATVINQDHTAEGYGFIYSGNIKGTMPALTQLRVRNMVSGAWAAIGKLWYARRTEDILGNFEPVLEGGTPDTDSSIYWSIESDNSRRSDNFQRYAPPEAANDQWASLYYSIPNITEQEGKAAIAVICRSLAEGREDWDLKAALQVADVIVETDVKNVATVGVWTVLILGELDIPPTPISADESYATKLYIYLKRYTGDESSAMDIDFVLCLYVDEYPQQVNITDGFTDSYTLLMENFKQELCHVVDQSTLALEKVAEALCPLLKLRPGKDNRIDFIWERVIKGVLEDDFEDYEAWHWLKIGDFESDENWSFSNMAYNTDHYVEGARGVRTDPDLDAGTVNYYAGLTVDLDLSQDGRFTNDDYVVMSLRKYTTDVDNVEAYVDFRKDGSNFYRAEWPNIQAYTNNRWYSLIKKKSDCTQTGSPDWADVNEIRAMVRSMDPGPIDPNQQVWLDSIVLVKADPDDATVPNPTGAVWDFNGGSNGLWMIEDLDGTTKYLQSLNNDAAVEKVATIADSAGLVNIKYLAKVQAKKYDGYMGLVFRCTDDTSGSEDMAAFYIDTPTDLLYLRKWTAGSFSDLATPLSQTTAPDTDYWLGVWMIGDRVRCYFGTSKAAIWDDENKEFVASARKFSVTNAIFASGGALASGKAGLLSIDTLGRFGDVELWAGDGHVPGDTIEVQAKALYRTIYPFRV